MVKFDLVLNDGRICIETVDDAEGTPGTSRQYTRFNAECKPDLERLLGTYDGIAMDDERNCLVEYIMCTLANHNFVKSGVVHLRDSEGNLTNRIRVFIESIEP